MPTTDPRHSPLHDHDHDHDHAHGLHHDLQALQAQARRRQALRWLAGLGTVGALPLLGCGGGSDDAEASTRASSSTDTGSSTSSGSCSAVPAETAGPYPADGSQASGSRLNALALAGIVRSDIRTSVASASGTAQGVPMTLTLNVVNANASCAPLAGYAVYLWHCTRDGNYSLYSSSIANENYLRGVQVSDANGQLTFTTIFPGCYVGRWPHLHFEVYPSLAVAVDATAVGDYTRVSQIALPESICRNVYGTATGYASSLSALNNITLASDNVFSDGVALQMATVSGDVVNGYTATLQVAVAA